MIVALRESVEGVAVDILIEAGAWPARTRLRSTAERAVAIALDHAAPDLAPGAEVSLVFTDDAHSRALNRGYRGKDRPTNVLSFPAAPPMVGRLGPLLGDIVIACETVNSEAEAAGLAPADHLTHLIVHGFLHLLGYDHEDDSQALVMERLETAILKDLGIADPHAA